MDISLIREHVLELRREAYVKAVRRSMLSSDVVGFIGNIPVDILMSFGLMAIPVDGADTDILKFSTRDDLCSIIDSTYTYAETDKCPLIHSSKIIVMEDFCSKYTNEMKKLLGDKIYIYEGPSKLKKKLSKVYGKEEDLELLKKVEKDLHYISEALEKLSETSISSRFLYELEFYLQFTDIKERKDIIEKLLSEYRNENRLRKNIYIERAIQILDEIDSKYENYRIVEWNFTKSDYRYKKCIHK